MNLFSTIQHRQDFLIFGNHLKFLVQSSSDRLCQFNTSLTYVYFIFGSNYCTQSVTVKNVSGVVSLGVPYSVGVYLRLGCVPWCLTQFNS